MRLEGLCIVARLVRLLVLLLSLVAALGAGCGGGGENEAEREAEDGSGRGTVTCEGSPMSGDLGLPADFPQIEGITYVASEQSGPTRAVDGYAEKGLEELFDEYQSGFEDAQYEILFDEREEDDAEISYRAASDDTEGIVALRSCDEDKTSVHITNRPG